jgi:hypothetical protein
VVSYRPSSLSTGVIALGALNKTLDDKAMVKEKEASPKSPTSRREHYEAAL